MVNSPQVEKPLLASDLTVSLFRYREMYTRMPPSIDTLIHSALTFIADRQESHQRQTQPGGSRQSGPYTVFGRTDMRSHLVARPFCVKLGYVFQFLYSSRNVE